MDLIWQIKYKMLAALAFYTESSILFVQSPNKKDVEILSYQSIRSTQWAVHRHPKNQALASVAGAQHLEQLGPLEQHL